MGQGFSFGIRSASSSVATSLQLGMYAIPGLWTDETVMITYIITQYGCRQLLIY